MQVYAATLAARRTCGIEQSMDSQRDELSGHDAGAEDGAPTRREVADAIGSDERRMHVRAYNYWCSLLDGRDFPSIQNLQADEIEDFSSHSVLLNFDGALNNPTTPFVGEAIRAEIGAETIKRISDVPGRSLLSRLTDHHFQIIATRAPVGFEADFVNQRGHDISYRGILMPFSSDGHEIDFVYGVINWKDNGRASDAKAPLRAMLPAIVAEREDEQDILDMLAAEERAHEERDHKRAAAMASLEPNSAPDASGDLFVEDDLLSWVRSRYVSARQVPAGQEVMTQWHSTSEATRSSGGSASPSTDGRYADLLGRRTKS